MSEALSEIRDGIDRVDDQIAELLCKRAGLAREVRNIKKGGQLSTYAPSREKEIVQRVLPRCLEAGFSREHVEGVFLSVISACRAIVGDIEVCVHGFPGSQAYAAAIKQFGTLKNIFCVQDMSQMLSRIEQGFSQFGLIPVSDGSGIRTATIDSLVSHDLVVVAERKLHEEYSVYSFESDAASVLHLYGEADALSSVDTASLELAREVGIQLIPSDARSLQGVRSLLHKSKGSGLLAAPGLASVLGIPCLLEGVPLRESRTVRYYVLGKEACPTGAGYTTALVCALRDTGGALRELLEPFSKYGVNLLTLESRHRKGAAWECMFFLEVEGGAHEEALGSALSDIEKICTYMKVLGSFPSVEE
jgi:chorismate mutase / prephenate dehydratase